MNLKKKLLLIASIFILSLGFTMTAEASSMRFLRNVIIMTEGQSKTLILKNSKSTPVIDYYDSDGAGYTYRVLSKSRIRVTAKRSGINYINVTSGNRRCSCRLVVMPKKNKALKTKSTSKGTYVSYKKVRLTLPKQWKKVGYVIRTGDDYISFHAKSSYKTGYNGSVFDINWCSPKKWRQLKRTLPNYTFLKRKGNVVYYMTEPTDVQFNTTKARYRNHYSTLIGTIKTIRKSFKVK